LIKRAPGIKWGSRRRHRKRIRLKAKKRGGKMKTGMEGKGYEDAKPPKTWGYSLEVDRERGQN